MLDKYKIRGNPEVYTIAVNSFSQSGDWDFACNVYTDMKSKGVVPDEVFRICFTTDDVTSFALHFLPARNSSD